MFEQLNNWFECDVVMFLVPRFLASLAIALLIHVHTCTSIAAAVHVCVIPKR